MKADASIAYVRPGPEGLDWLATAVAELKAGDPLRPVAIVVPNYVAGRFVRRYLGRAVGSLNLRALRLVEVATAVAPPHLDTKPLLTPVLEASAVRAAVDQAGGPLKAMAGHLSLHDALTRLFRELRRQELDVDATLEGEPGAMTATALRTYLAFQRLTARYMDPTEVRDAATRVLDRAAVAPAAVREVGALVLFQPTRFDPADARLLAAVGRFVPLHAAFPRLDDPDRLGQESARRSATMLAEALGLPSPVEPPRPAALRLGADVRVLRAPDPAEETREVLRAIAADLEAGVPLHRIAVLYRQTEPYAPLVREALRLSGFPRFGLGGRALAESLPGRALLAALSLPERRFARETVLAWVDAAPEATIADRVPASAWDRVSRAAGVVHGVDEWQERLLAFAELQDQDATTRERDGMPARAAALRQQASQARVIRDVVAALAAGLVPPTGAATWRALVDWAEAVRTRFASAGGTWPEPDRADAVLVAETLRELERGDTFGTRGPSLALFLATLRSALDQRSLPEGRLGDGVLVGPVQSAVGLAFDRVYLLGLSEGAFPPTPAADPFFARESDDPLQRHARQRAADRQAFLAALAAGDGGRVTLSAPDSLGGRPAFPSRWLLEVATRLQPPGGQPLDAIAFRALGESEQPWVRVVRSAQGGVERMPAPADLEDRRLSEAAEWQASGRPLVQHALARRVDLPIASGLRVTAARRSSRFTIYDGNLAALAGRASLLQRLLDGSGAVSATAIETWAGCPFQYFVERVLRAEPTEVPAETWTIDALQKGSLVHGVLETFFRALAADSRPTAAEPYTEADVALLERIAEEQFEEARRKGLTRHALVWEATRKEILADLRAFLVEDESWRRQEVLAPRYFEQPFGTGDPNAWPAVEMAVGDATLRFRGYIDRVDLSPDGKRAFAFDYKTGSPTGFAKLKDDPVLQGLHVQMAVYTRAVRGGLGDGVQVGGAYWFVTSKGEFARIDLPADPSLVDGRLESTLGTVASGIQQGVFPAVPGSEDRGSFQHCRLCAYGRVCSSARDQEWERKQSDGCEAYLALASAPHGGEGGDA